MMSMKRRSPLHMGLDPARVITVGGWEIALSYYGETTHSSLVVSDLSHIRKWSIQHRGLENVQVFGLPVPPRPRGVHATGGMVLARLGNSEARLMAWEGDFPSSAVEPFWTDVTDAAASLAVVGPRCYDLLGKLSSVDLGADPVPSAAMAPLEDVTCLIIQLRGEHEIPGLIISCARGYGHFLIHAILDSGREYGIQAAGWERFTRWARGMESLS
ncbi:MAG: hypothetical protein GX443_04500 [Deltaproteobacteria bacterium]|nr:hypothetical protein [Deltaproteobacteria bacterium]